MVSDLCISTATVSNWPSYKVLHIIAVPTSGRVIGVKTIEGHTQNLLMDDGSEFTCDPTTAEFWKNQLQLNKFPWE